MNAKIGAPRRYDGVRSVSVGWMTDADVDVIDRAARSMGVSRAQWARAVLVSTARTLTDAGDLGDAGAGG